MRIPNLYLKWHAFRELADLVDTDKDIGIHLFRHEDGAEPFAKLLRGDIGCPADIAEGLADYMNRRLSQLALRSEKEMARGSSLRASDLELSTLAFVARLVALLPDISEDRLDRAHRALIRDMTVANVRAVAPTPQLTVERYAAGRTFGSSVLPSGGSGPPVFTIGQHKGQLSVTGLSVEPVAVYTMFTRDPAPTGRRPWDFAWGETVLWLPSPFRPKLADGRLPLMEKAEPVNATPGHFHVTTALVWQAEARTALDPRPEKAPPGALDEAETSLFLTRLRRMVEDKRRKWEGAINVLTAEYIVQEP